jgi:uncharacterized protein YdhG (YjbR/CyaY superfamily)
MKKGEYNIPKTVDEYLKDLPSEVSGMLNKLRATIKSAAPHAEEIISYQIPTYKYHGALVHFAAFESHCSFFVVSKSILTMFEKELEPYKTSGTTIHFSTAKPLPVALVKKIVKARIKDNEERNAIKGIKKQKS